MRILLFSIFACLIGLSTILYSNAIPWTSEEDRARAADSIAVGQIISKPSTTNRIYADYDAISGDSGAPVGKVLSGQITIYGIHEGTVESNPNLEKYVPYDAIKNSLGLT